MKRKFKGLILSYRYFENREIFYLKLCPKFSCFPVSWILFNHVHLGLDSLLGKESHPVSLPVVHLKGQDCRCWFYTTEKMDFLLSNKTLEYYTDFMLTASRTLNATILIEYYLKTLSYGKNSFHWTIKEKHQKICLSDAPVCAIQGTTFLCGLKNVSSFSVAKDIKTFPL